MTGDSRIFNLIIENDGSGVDSSHLVTMAKAKAKSKVLVRLQYPMT
jgi:hypothetical protein